MTNTRNAWPACSKTPWSRSVRPACRKTGERPWRCGRRGRGRRNTFQLLRTLYTTGLLRAIRKRVPERTALHRMERRQQRGLPTVMTTNDMPICEPPSLHALHVVGFRSIRITRRPRWRARRRSRDQRLASTGAEPRPWTVARPAGEVPCCVWRVHR